MLTLAEAMLQKKCPRGGVESRHHQTEELSVTQSEYESAAEREYAEQETLKYWYENNVGYHVWKKKCETCGKVFYTICNYRKYCHLPIAEVSRSRSESKKESRSIIPSISALSAQHLL